MTLQKTPDGQEAEPVAAPPIRRVGTFAALGYRNYRLFWIGNAISFIGDWLDQIALNWLVITTTGNPVMLGLVNLGRGLPLMVFSAIGGVVADRIDRRRMLLMTQAAAMMAAILLAVTVAFLDSAIWIIVLLATCRGIIVAFNLPARHSLVPQLVPREAMPSAVSINSITINTAKILGPLAAAGIIATLGLTACFVINALSFTAVMFSLTMLDLPKHEVQRKAEPMLASLVGGMAYMRREPVLLMLVAVALVPTFFCQPYIQFLAVFAAQVFETGPQGLGVMTALAALGSISGGFLAARLQRDARSGSTMLKFMAGFGLFLILFAFAPNIYVAVPMLFAAGAMHIAYNTSNNTILQMTVDDAYRGRVLSWLFITRGLMPLGVATMAVFSVLVGPRLAMALMASVVVIFAAFLWTRMPAMRNLRV